MTAAWIARQNVLLTRPMLVGNKTIAVIIPAHNAAETIASQLKALSEQSWTDFETIVVSNRSADGTEQVAQKWSGHLRSLRVVSADEAAGAAYARNYGVSIAAADVILFCDADDVVHRRWVEAHAKALRLSPASTGPLLLRFADGRRGQTWNSSSAPVSMGYAPYAPSCNFGIKRQIFVEVGGFDQSLVLGHEDVDLGWRLVAAGHEISHVKEAVIDYHQRSNLPSLLRQQFRYGMAFAELYAKHKPDCVSIQSRRWRIRWWIELVRGSWSSKRKAALGPLIAFQIGRASRSRKLRMKTPMW